MVPSGPVRATLLIVSIVGLDEIVVDQNLELDFAEQVRLVLVAAIHLRSGRAAGHSLGRRKPSCE